MPAASADYTNAAVRLVSSSGIMTTVAGFIGNGIIIGSSGSAGSGGGITNARFSNPMGLISDSVGGVYVSGEMDCNVCTGPTRFQANFSHFQIILMAPFGA